MKQFSENEEGKPSDNLKMVLDFLKDPSSERATSSLEKIAKAISPHPLWRISSDLMISGICIFAILYSATKRDMLWASVS